MRKARRLPLESLAPFLLPLADPPAPIAWASLFGNENSVEIEVGFGKGGFLVEAGETNPRINYIGIEVDRGLQLYVATRLAKRELPNVRVALCDGRIFLRDHVAAESVQAIHVYFPDPWWKKRHKKRRVFTEQFAAECERVLQFQGRLLIATDVEEYFGVMTQLVAERTLLRPVEILDKGPASMTNFERKALQHGGQVWRAVYEKFHA